MFTTREKLDGRVRYRIACAQDPSSEIRLRDLNKTDADIDPRKMLRFILRPNEDYNEHARKPSSRNKSDTARRRVNVVSFENSSRFINVSK